MTLLPTTQASFLLLKLDCHACLPSTLSTLWGTPSSTLTSLYSQTCKKSCHCKFNVLSYPPPRPHSPTYFNHYSQSHYSHLFSYMYFSVPLDQFLKVNFWKDLCRAKKGVVFFYHMQNAWVAKSSKMKGLRSFIGRYNNAMNQCILQLCKEFPLSLLCFSKQYMIDNGAVDLFHLKPRIIRNMAENIIR